jgi:hypothetical protein
MNLERLERKLSSAGDKTETQADDPSAELLPKVSRETLKKAGRLTVADYYADQLSHLELILLKHGAAAPGTSWERMNAPISLKKTQFRDKEGSIAAAIMRVDLY